MQLVLSGHAAFARLQQALQGDIARLVKAFQGYVDGLSPAVNTKPAYNDDDMKVITRDGLVQRVSKLIDERVADYESDGLFSVCGDVAREQVLQTLEQCAQS